MLWSVVCFLLMLAYVGLMVVYWFGWKKAPETVLPAAGVLPTLRITVAIAARNEANHIQACLNSILACRYPADLLEILVIDDHSTDNTTSVVNSIIAAQKNKIRLILLSETGKSGKKSAIEQAVANATGSVVLITDADCTVPPDWILLFAAAFEQDPGATLITGPVAFHREQSDFERFQSLDFLGMMGITGAGIHLDFQRMGNGACLAFRKSVFEAVGGYREKGQLASGDDMFLVQKVAHQFPGSVRFLKNKNATVLTLAKPTLAAFIRQRLRWGTKNTALPEWPIRIALLAVFLFCWSILFNLVYSGIQLYQRTDMLTYGALVIVQIMAKMAFDYLFLREMCHYFDRKDLLKHFRYSFILHTLYIPFVGIGSLFLKKFEWKGRITK
jgi:glycosyltransferase involved in cell wall biosynthesis